MDRAKLTKEASQIKNCSTNQEISIMNSLYSENSNDKTIYHRMLGQMINPEGSDKDKINIGQTREKYNLGKISQDSFALFMSKYSNSNKRIKEYVEQYEEYKKNTNDINDAKLGMKEIFLLKSNPTIVELALAATSKKIKKENPEDFSYSEHTGRWTGAFNATQTYLKEKLKAGDINVIKDIFDNNPEKASKIDINIDKEKPISIIKKKNNKEQDFPFLDACLLSMEESLKSKIQISKSPAMTKKVEEKTVSILPQKVEDRRVREIVGMSNDFIRSIGQNDTSLEGLELGRERMAFNKQRSNRLNPSM